MSRGGQNEERHHGSVPPRRTARRSISEDNPAGTNGFEFVEFAHPDPEVLEALFARMGYSPVARHRTKAITVWRQGDINYILNAEKGSFADRFVGPMVPAHPPWPGALPMPGRHWRMPSRRVRRNTPARTRRSMSRPSSASADRCSISSTPGAIRLGL
jgi:hypothetical protein